MISPDRVCASGIVVARGIRDFVTFHRWNDAMRSNLELLIHNIVTGAVYIEAKLHGNKFDHKRNFFPKRHISMILTDVSGGNARRRFS